MGISSGHAAATLYKANTPRTSPVIAYEGLSSRKANQVMGGGGGCNDDAENVDDKNDVALVAVEVE